MISRIIREWPQRERFRQLVDDYLEAHDQATKATLAKAIGIQESSLVTYYSGKREPGKATLRKIAIFFKVPMGELADDPGVEVPGVPQSLVAQLTPAKRLILLSVAQKIGPDDVTDETAENVWKALATLVELGKIPAQR